MINYDNILYIYVKWYLVLSLFEISLRFVWHLGGRDWNPFFAVPGVFANTMGFVEALVEAEVPLERSDQSVPCFFFGGVIPPRKTIMEPENDGF